MRPPPVSEKICIKKRKLELHGLLKPKEYEHAIKLIKQAGKRQDQEIENLTLHENNINDKDLSEMLDESDSESLKALICYKNEIGLQSIKAITRIISRHTSSLCELRLSNLRLSPSLLNQFVFALSQNQTLNKLSL